MRIQSVRATQVCKVKMHRPQGGAYGVHPVMTLCIMLIGVYPETHSNTDAVSNDEC